MSHRLYDPLKDEWVIVTPKRSQVPSRDLKIDTNPLDPGSSRPGGQVNPVYESTFVFDNDFPALGPIKKSDQILGNTDLATMEYNKCRNSGHDQCGFSCLELTRSKNPKYSTDSIIDQLTSLTPIDPIDDSLQEPDPFFKTSSALGQCRVVCYHPNDNLQLSLTTHSQIRSVIDTLITETDTLSKTYRWVKLFENKGSIGSNSRPHCQIWASDFLPSQALIKDRTQKSYFKKHKSPMLLDYCHRELQIGERIVEENDHFVVLVPFWAVWDFETMIIPKRHVQRLPDLDEEEKSSLASIMKILLIKYDNLFSNPCTYRMGWHQAPGDSECQYWQFHAVYSPPLNQYGKERKTVGGYEMNAEYIRSSTPESAAHRLRRVSGDQHYSIV